MSCDAKGRPIAFSAPMVRAVLGEVDPKTQARRIAKFQPLEGGLNKAFSGLRPALIGDAGRSCLAARAALGTNERSSCVAPTARPVTGCDCGRPSGWCLIRSPTTAPAACRRPMEPTVRSLWPTPGPGKPLGVGGRVSEDQRVIRSLLLCALLAACGGGGDSYAPAMVPAAEPAVLDTVVGMSSSKLNSFANLCGDAPSQTGDELSKIATVDFPRLRRIRRTFAPSGERMTGVAGGRRAAPRRIDARQPFCAVSVACSAETLHFFIPPCDSIDANQRKSQFNCLSD